MTFTLARTRRASILTFIFNAILLLSLAACGGSSGGGAAGNGNTGGGDGNNAPPDTTAPAAAAPESKLALREALRIVFNEPIDSSSLELGGTLAALSDGGEWNDDNTQLTLLPASGAWESGVQRLTVDAADIAGNAMETLDASFEIRLVFENFQPASVVIGQADFAGSQPNQGGDPAANTLGTAYGQPRFDESGRLWIPDYDNNRLLGFDGIPEANNASATWVVGQADFVSTSSGRSATEFGGNQQGIEHDGRFYMLEYDNNRITVFDGIPLTPPATAAHVIGQHTLVDSDSDCSATVLSYPEDMIIADGKLVVADSGHNRVLIWNRVPKDTDGAPADIVLGQESMTNCAGNDHDQDGMSDAGASASAMFMPTAVWSDGGRLVVVDTLNNRVLIWNTFPQENFQPADVVLGQSDFAHNLANDDDQDGAVDPETPPTARTLLDPYEGVWSNGLQLFVSDSGNNRVLVWNRFPTENFQPADAVLGQSDFIHNAGNDHDQDGSWDPEPTARTLAYPVGGGVRGDRLLVLDEENSRVLVYESL